MPVRVLLDLTKPLCRGLKLRISEEEMTWCPIMYEKFPDICFNCGLVGHSIRECQQKLSEAMIDNDNGYDDWLRATLLKRNNSQRWSDGRLEEGRSLPSMSGRGDRFFGRGRKRQN